MDECCENMIWLFFTAYIDRTYLKNNFTLLYRNEVSYKVKIAQYIG